MKQYTKQKCFTCDEQLPLLKCGKCKFANYCSQKCQIDDWSDHKLVCFSELSERLLRVYKLQNENKQFRRNEIYLSSPIYNHYMNNKLHVVQPYGSSILGNHCVECSKKIKQIGDLKDVQFTFIKDNNTVVCYRCYDCSKKGTNFCSNTFMDSKKCFEKKVKLFLVTLNHNNNNIPFIPQEIKQIIFSLFKLCKCCK